MKFANISFRNKILLLLALPLIGFLWMSISSITANIAIKNDMTEMSKLTELSTVYSSVVHELQKERGATAGFIGSNGTKFRSVLNKQRLMTDEKINMRSSFWNKSSHDNVKVIDLHNKINTALDKINSIRARVDSQTITIQEALKYYTQINAKLLSVSEIISHYSTHAEISENVIAYYNFLQGKERAGVERAVMSNTFATNKFTPALFIKFITLVSEQNTYFNNFTVFATDTNRQFFETTLKVEAVNEVERMRKIALEKATVGNFGIDANYWFDQSTLRITQLKKVEDQLGEAVKLLSHHEKDIANNAMIKGLAFSLIIGCLVVAIGTFIIKDLNSRIKDLMQVLTAVREKNDLTVTAKYNDTSELGQMSYALNQTLQTFGNAITEISNASIDLAAESEQTAQTCEYSFKNLEGQQSEIALVATAVEELSSTVKEVAMNMQSAADVSKSTDAQAQNGLDTVQKSYQSIEVLANEINNLAERITSLHESSLNITNIVDVIKSVADQTNLLALNAAIEAARAGEQGRGFAVVADEVRTLAKRTQDSTSEIESFIVNLQSDANSAFSVIENSQKKAIEAVTNSKEVEQSLNDITQSISHISSLNEQVAVAVEEQAVVTQEVAKNVVNIESKALESVAGSKQISSTAKHQASLAVSLQEIAKQFIV